MCQVIRFYKGFYKKQIIEFQREEVVLKQKLKIMQLDLQKLV